MKEPGARWRRVTFGPASELPYRRWPSDAVRVAVAAVAVAALAARRADVTRTGRSVFEFLNGLPEGAASLVSVMFRAGTLWAAGLVVAVALLGRRWRLARDLALAGLLAWLLSRFIGQVTLGGHSATGAVRSVLRLGHGSPSFPVVRLSVIVAVIATAHPYVTRPTRRLGQVLVVAAALGAMYLGLGLPAAVVAAILLGWGIAALVHLAFGSPGGRPTSAQVAAALHQLGVDATDVHLSPTQPPEMTLMEASDPHGPLLVRVMGRDERQAQLLHRGWQTIIDSSVPGRFLRSRIETVEHEGYMLLRAATAGVRVPPLVATGAGGPGTALRVERALAGTSLGRLDPSALTQATLEDVWRQVRLLHDSGVVHLDLTATRVVCGPQGPALVAFERATASTLARDRGRDVAGLLAGTARLVGTDRAVAAAASGLGHTPLAEVLPMLQSAALPRSVRPIGRTARSELRTLLGGIRTAVSRAVGEEPPPLEELHRVSARTLLLAIGTFLGVAALLRQVGDPAQVWDTVSRGRWQWIALALLVALGTNLPAAVALMGSVPIRLPFLRTAQLQLGLSFATMAVPSVGGMGTQVRFLQKQGLDLASAAAGGGLINGAGDFVASLSLFLLAVDLSPSHVLTGRVSEASFLKVLVIAAVALGVASAVVFGVRRIRTRVLGPVQDAWGTISAVVRRPAQLARVILGWAVQDMLYAVVLYLCVVAFGATVDLWTVVVVELAVSTLASAVPVPGGSAAVGSVGTAGALVAVGVPKEVAVAAALTNQVVSSFLPAVPGWLAFQDLVRRDYL